MTAEVLYQRHQLQQKNVKTVDDILSVPSAEERKNGGRVLYRCHQYKTENSGAGIISTPLQHKGLEHLLHNIKTE